MPVGVILHDRNTFSFYRVGNDHSRLLFLCLLKYRILPKLLPDDALDYPGILWRPEELLKNLAPPR